MAEIIVGDRTVHIVSGTCVQEKMGTCPSSCVTLIEKIKEARRATEEKSGDVVRVPLQCQGAVEAALTRSKRLW